MLRPLLTWRAFWNLWTIYFFNFPFFFRAAVYRGYCTSGYEGTTVFRASCGLREVPKWARQELIYVLIHKEHFSTECLTPWSWVTSFTKFSKLSLCFQTSAFAARLRAAEEHDPVRQSTEHTQQVPSNMPKYGMNQYFSRPYCLKMTFQLAQHRSLFVYRTNAAHSAHRPHVPRRPWRWTL
jgi:hypothetical protein